MDTETLTRVDLAEAIEGYLECAGWLVNESYDENTGRVTTEERDDRGGPFSPLAVAHASDAVRDFLALIDGEDLDVYLSGRSMHDLGADLWLSRNGHGAGFFDRGREDAYARLQDDASSYGEAYAYWNETTGEVNID